MVLGTSWDLLSMRQQAVHPVSPWMFYLRSILGSGRSCKPVYFSGLSFWGIHERFSRGPKPCQNLPKLHLCTKSPKLPFHIIWYGACHNLSPSEATTILNSCHRRFSLSTCRARAKGDKSQGWVARQIIDNPLEMRLWITPHSCPRRYSSSGFTVTMICKAVGFKGWFSQSWREGM